MPKPLRIVLMGTGPFAVPSFDAIREIDYDAILAVVTKPTSYNAKGVAAPQPVLEWATQHGFPIYQPKSINDAEAIAHVQAMKPDLLIVCDYGQILSTDALNAGRLGGLNLHGSLLPRHRGAAPVQWSVLAGDEQAGVSIIHMTPKLDGGPVLRQASTKIGTHENAFQLEARLSQLGVNALLDSIEQLRSTGGVDVTTVVGVPQNPAEVTKAPRLAKQDGQFDPRYPVAILDRLVRGLQPWPGVFGELEMDGSKRMRVAFQQVVPHAVEKDASTSRLVASHPAGSLVWGKMLEGTNGMLLAIVCKDGLLEIASLQPAGKRAMTAKEFLAGYGRCQAMQMLLPESPNALLDKLMLC